MRVYVGALNTTDTAARNTVLLQIKTTPPLAGQTVWLRAFDVDDPTTSKVDPNGVIDINGASEDNFDDYLITPHTGAFMGNGQATITATLNASGEATVEFQVGMQPGNNYRIAVTALAEKTTEPRDNNIRSLQVADPNGGLYVAADGSQVSGFNGTVSEMLTVWRKLHIEVDSMIAPPTSGPERNSLEGLVKHVRTDFPKVGQTSLIVNSDGERGEYAGGRIDIAGLGSYEIIQNVPAIVPGNTLMTINMLSVGSVVSLSASGRSFVLYDDDDRYLQELGLFPSGQSSPLPRDQLSGETIQGMRRAFTYAYVGLEDANAMSLNPRKQIPFKLQAGLGWFDGNGGIFDDAKDIFDSELFWAQTLVFGYQPDRSDDGDPGTERTETGITAKRVGIYRGGVSVVYIEGVREEAQSILAGGNSLQFKQREYKAWIYGIAAHEVGHGPGNQTADQDHAELALMNEDGAALSLTPEGDFARNTIKRFRQTSRWSQ